MGWCWNCVWLWFCGVWRVSFERAAFVFSGSFPWRGWFGSQCHFEETLEDLLGVYWSERKRESSMSWAGPDDVLLSTSLASYLDSTFPPPFSLSVFVCMKVGFETKCDWVLYLFFENLIALRSFLSSCYYWWNYIIEFKEIGSLLSPFVTYRFFVHSLVEILSVFNFREGRNFW